MTKEEAVKKLEEAQIYHQKQMTLACLEGMRLRSYLKNILLWIDYMPGKMKDRLEAAADLAEEGLWDADRWQGFEKYERFHVAVTGGSEVEDVVRASNDEAKQ